MRRDVDRIVMDKLSFFPELQILEEAVLTKSPNANQFPTFPTINLKMYATNSDGTCLLHSFLQCLSDAYRKINNNKSTTQIADAIRSELLPNYIQNARLPFAPDRQYLLTEDSAYLAAKFNLGIAVISLHYGQLTLQPYRPNIAMQDFIIIIHVNGNHFESVQWNDQFLHHNLAEFIQLMQTNGTLIEENGSVKPLEEFVHYDDRAAYIRQYEINASENADNFLLNEILKFDFKKSKIHDNDRLKTLIADIKITGYDDDKKIQVMKIMNHQNNSALKKNIMKKKPNPTVKRSARIARKGGRHGRRTR